MEAKIIVDLIFEKFIIDFKILILNIKTFLLLKYILYIHYLIWFKKT